MWDLREEVFEDFVPYLTPAHRSFLDSLNDWEKAILFVSMDPFQTLRLLWLSKAESERQTWDSQSSTNNPPPSEL